MRIGIAFHATDLAMPVPELAREAEARGFDSLYIPEHTHIPVSRRTPPPTGDAELAEEYKRSPDPLIVLAGAATVTERIRLGTAIGLPAQHDPIALAKQIASLDQLSGGRVTYGIGYGWNLEEMESHGIDVKRRRARVREVMLAMEALWSEEVASFSGEFVRFEASWQWPKPVQQPRPPILIGAAPGPTLYAHTAEYADGWIPFGGAGMKQALPELRRAFEERGRDPAELQVVPMGVFPDEGKLAYYAEQGVRECVLRVPSAPRDRVLPVLDDHARFTGAG
jgi:probable F420-dependent oxidoreductase